MKIRAVLVMSVMLLSACQQKPQNYMLVFGENEDGVDPYQTRIISTPDYLRFDDGQGSEDFVLFDRKQQKIYRITSEGKTVMAVEKKQHKIEPPIELKHTVKKMPMLKDVPDIKGKTPQHYQYLTNDEVCVDVVSVEGLMEDVLKGMRDFQLVLASDSATTFATMPADMHEPCSISFSTFAPVRHLEKGFPIQEWKQGYSRALIDFKENYKVDPKLFTFPEDYFVYRLQDFREGRVDFEKRKVLTDEEIKAMQPDTAKSPVK